MRIQDIELTLQNIANANEVTVVGVKPFRKYVDGKITDAVGGYTYECVATCKKYAAFNIKVEEKKPSITEEVLDANNGEIIATPIGFIGKYCTLKNVSIGVAAIAIIAAATLLLLYVLNKVFQFIALNGEFLIMLRIVFFSIWTYFYNKFKNKTEIVEPPIQHNPPVDKISLQYNYEVLRKVLYQVIPDIAESVNLRSPERFSELDPPTKWFNRADVTFYNFVCAKTSALDCNLVKEVLQMRISQRLNANEIEGIKVSTAHLFNGQAFPRIMVDNVSQSGSYCEICLVFVNDAYCTQLHQRRLVAYESEISTGSHKDMGSQPPYGYARNPNNRHQLIADPYSSLVVQKIFDLFVGGDSARHIADILNRKTIDTPNNYYYKSLGKPNPYREKIAAWGSATIMNMLRSEVYIGNTVQGKQHVKSFKDKKRIKVSKEDWVIVENTHEAIVNVDTWNEAQKRIIVNNPVRINSQKEVSLFSGLVKCADCGGLMAYNVKTSGDKRYYVYRCGTYANNGKNACSVHTIHQSTLEQIVLNDLQYYSKLAIKDENTLIDRLMTANASNQQRVSDIHKKQIATIKKRIVEVDNLAKSLFEEKVKGNIPSGILKKMLSDYENEQGTLQEDLIKLQKELSECESNERDVDVWIQKIKKCISIETLDRNIVVELIDNIAVSEVYKIDGEKHQDVTITYKFVGCLDDNKKLFVA